MAIPTDGLDFYLPFDADMDEKIHSLTGTLSSSNAAKYFMLSSDTAGNFLQCINTQGSNSYYLKYPGSESLMQYGTGDFSVSFWLRSPNWSYFMNVVFEKKYDDNQDGFVVYADGSEPVLDMRIRNQADHFTETYCNSSVFLHWCFVRVGTVGYWYCNGVLDSTTEGAVTGSVSNDELFKIGYSAAWTYKQAVFDLKALRIYNRALSDSEITELSKEFADEGTSGGTGVVIDGLFLSTSKPTANQKGLLVNNKFFIPFAESSGSGDTSAFESDAMAIIGTPTEEGGDIEPISQKYMTVTSTDDVGCGVGIEFTGTIQIVEDGVATLYTTSPISNIALRNATVYGDNITYFNCGSTNLASVDPSHNDQLVTLICSNGYLTALDISNNSLLTTLEANSNNLSSAVVDKILSDLVAHGKSNGLLRLENSAGIGAASNGAPTSQNNVTTLQSRGWTVTTA